MVAVGIFPAREEFGLRVDDLFPACVIFILFFNGDQLAHTSSTL